MKITTEIMKKYCNMYDTQSNTFIAKSIVKDYNLSSDVKNIENIRKRIGEFRKEYLYNPKDLYLVIGDIHAPYNHKDYLKHCLSVKRKWESIAKILYIDYTFNTIIIGDEIDNHAISYHEHNPDLSSAGDELIEAKIELSKWHNAFPNAYVTEGNHSLVKRKMFSSGIPKAYMKNIAEVLGVNTWKYTEEVVTDKLLFTHGTKLSKTSINTKALTSQKSVICGHHHTSCKIEYLTQSIFTMFVGCGININSPAFDYARGYAKEPIISCAVIVDNKPIIEIYEG